MGLLADRWRHYNMLLMGTHLQAREIDAINFLPKVSHWATCEWYLGRLREPLKWKATKVVITRGVYLADKYGMFSAWRKGLKYLVEGDMPRDFLDGHCYFELYNTQD